MRDSISLASDYCCHRTIFSGGLSSFVEPILPNALSLNSTLGTCGDQLTYHSTMPTIRLRRSSISLGLPHIRIERNGNPYINIERQSPQFIHLLAKSASALALNQSHSASRPYRKVVPRFNKRETAVRLQQLQHEKMASQGSGVVVEERRSFGIGGAGNIR